MTTETEEQDLVEAASEQPQVESREDQQEESQKMVPLSALQATRRKLQEAEAKASAYHEIMLRAKETQAEPAEPEDPNGLVERKHLKETTAETKREILETLFLDLNPKAVHDINNYLDPILTKKPWLRSSIDSALNRYARAFEIVQDYKHLLEEKPAVKRLDSQDGQRIVQNAHKPRSPAEVGKSAQPGGMDYLKSIQGKQEFRDYRKKLLQG